MILANHQAEGIEFFSEQTKFFLKQDNGINPAKSITNDAIQMYTYAVSLDTSRTKRLTKYSANNKSA
jgi:hypothetical protein